MDAFKIIAVGVTGAVLALTVKEYRPEIAIGIGIVTGVVILLYIAGGLGSIFYEIEEIINRSGVEQEYLAAVIKIVGVSYVTQFGAEICRDSGQGAIAMKIEMAGKVIVLLLTMPIIGNFLDVCINTVNIIN